MPVGDELGEVAPFGPVVPARARHLLGEPRARQTLPEVDQVGLGDGDGEGFDGKRHEGEAIVQRPPDPTIASEYQVDHTYKITEIVGSSAEGIDDAIKNGIGRAAKTLRNLDWFEVTDVRGAMNDGEIAWYQVTMKVGFRLDDGD